MVLSESSEISISIKNAVCHLKQLGESFQSNVFNENDLNNIDLVADTLMALEKEIASLHVDHETQSIELSRLRHRLKLLPTAIKNEIQEAVNMARGSNASVIQTLQKELDSLLEKVRMCTEQDKQLTTTISALQAEKNALQHQYDTTITQVNQRVSDKATLQISLNETRDTVRETNQHTFDLEEDIMALKECLMQERNEARQEKVRLEEEIADTFKRFNEQEATNELLKKDVDAATLRVSETELQLRTMYRERERFDNENEELTRQIQEQTDLLEAEQQEHNRLLQERLQYTETCGTALLNYQAKKKALEQREASARERTDEEIEKLKVLKQKHEDITKAIEEHLEISKSLTATLSETGKGLDEIKAEIALKLEKTAKLNLDNAETTKQLDSMREAHQIMVDSLKLQTLSLEKELQNIRATRIAKQKERENLLKTIEQTKLTSRNNDIRHNRFVTQTTGKINDLTERKTILDRNAREDQLQLNQLSQRLVDLQNEYEQTKVQFEEQIKFLEESTSQLLTAIEANRNKIVETTPEFERLKVEHEEITTLYEATKETMIETKRKKHETVEKIAQTQRNIREKQRSRDVSMMAVKECQNETKQRMEKAHQDMLILEDEIYEKGCRLETLEDENERFQNTVDYLNHQIELFNRFAAQSHIDIKHLNDDNHDLLNTLQIGWQDDRALEHKASEQDLKYINDLTLLLEHTEKRKSKVGTIVNRLVDELKHLKFYLEGMSSPTTPAISVPSPEDTLLPSLSSSRRSLHYSVSGERAQSATSPSKTTKAKRRPQSVMQTDASAPTPMELTDDVKQRVSIFLEKNFHLNSASSKKTSKANTSNHSVGQSSTRTDFSSLKSTNLSAPSPTNDDAVQRKPASLKVAFA